jgi:hypothetical protein
MQTTNHQEEQTYGGQSFAPRDFNARAQEPEAAEGEYTVTIQNAKFRVTPPDRGSDPQVNMQLKITAAGASDNEELSEKSIGGTLFDAITFFAPGSRSRLSNMQKRRYLELLEACGLEEDIMPATIKSEDDFGDLIEQLKGKEITVWVSHTPRADGKGVYVNVNYAAPRGSSRVEEEEEVEQPKARQASKAKSTASKGTSKRR